jgi:hypothetical protein
MNRQLYHQVAVINSKMQRVRTLLAEIETQQATLEELLHYRQGMYGMAGVIASVEEKPGEVYVDQLMRVGTLA